MAHVVEKMAGEASVLGLELQHANSGKQLLLEEVTQVRIEGAERAAEIETALENAKTEAHAAREELTMAEDRCATLDSRVVEVQLEASELSRALRTTRQEKQELNAQLEQAAVEITGLEALTAENEADRVQLSILVE